MLSCNLEPDIKISELELSRIKSVILLNSLIHAEIAKKHEDSGRKNERYIISSEKFQSAVNTARRNLGFINDEHIDEINIQQWAVQQMSLREVSETSNKKYFNYLKKFSDEISTATKNAGLPKQWEFYVACFVVNKEPPKSQVFTNSEYLVVENISDNGDIAIKLRPGLRQDDYYRAWKPLGKYLGSGKRLDKAYSSESTRKLIYEDKLSGLSYRDVAKKHFPNSDIILATDRVKKIIIREKKRFSEGINLTK